MTPPTLAGLFFCLASTRCRAFILPCCNAAAHKPPMHHLRHAGGHTVKCSTSSVYQIPPPRRTLYRSAQPPYYNKVYKGAAVRPCRGSMPGGAT
nr:MAG TPA: hypothetical protein [Caudoviricetes sp.]